jgi:hypothetical protein
MIYLVFFVLQIFLIYLLKRRTLQKIFRFFYKLTKNKKGATYIFAILFLPGTFIHEMSHFLFALFLLVPVGQIELMPEFEENGIRMGSVPIGKSDPIRRTLIGVAPVILGLSIILGSVFYVYQNKLFTNILADVILAYVVFEISNTMFSSKKDMEGSIVTAIIIAIIYAIIYLIGVRVSINVNPEIFKKADLFLLVPIGINLLFF